MITQSIATRGHFGGTVSLSTMGRLIAMLGEAVETVFPVLDLISRIVQMVSVDSEIENGDM